MWISETLGLLSATMTQPAAPTDLVTFALHELHTPLGLIAMLARSVADSSAETDVRQRCLDIERLSRRLLRTAQTALLLEQPCMDNEACHLAGSLRTVAGDMQRFGLQIELHVDDGQMAACSEEEFECIVGSLLQNARHHGDVAHPVIVTCGAVDGRPFVSISNRVSARRSHQGAGIGTAFVNRLVRRAGATLATENADGWYVATLWLNPYRTTATLDSAVHDSATRLTGLSAGVR